MKKSHSVILMALGAVVLVLAFGGGDDEPTYTDDRAQAVPVDFGTGTTETGAISDSTSDTIRTLIAETKLRDREIEQLMERINQVEGKASKQTSTPAVQDDPRVEELESKLSALSKRLIEIESSAIVEPEGVGIPDSIPSSLPVGNDKASDSTLSIKKPDFNQLVPKLLTPTLASGDDSGDERGAVMPSSGSIGAGMSGKIWVQPSDKIVSVDKNGKEVVRFPRDVKSESEKNTTDSSLNPSEDDPLSIPYYTIPANSTLADTVSMTAIIGRVPSGGTVVDPFRFKVVVGSKNLATNGFEMPHVESMVLSGVAKGDFTMECASGYISSATFTFTDGTVHVVESSSGDELGYIADEYGVPCVPGEYISNAAEYIALKGGLSGLGALGAALADGEMTKLTEAGSVSEVVTGDSLVYGVGSSVAGSGEALTDWIDERQKSAFDAVFISAGKTLSVHINRNLEIDYDPQGRMLEHSDKGVLL